ncbi:MAG: helix-turn-helix transcriptional regulator, partial [Firmicutes bacterium]|nr:helix-turn-helix transcriptional regulator [Bacillota bacterium]
MGISILPVDLKKRRAEHRMTQEDLAAMLDVTRVQVARIETGERNITLRNVLKCVDRFGGLKVRMGDSVYVIQKQESFGGDDDPRNGKPHDDIPNTEEHENLNGVEHFVNAYNQIEAGRAELRAALADPRTWRYDAEEGRAGRISVVKKLIDIREAADGALQEIHTDDFEVYQ